MMLLPSWGRINWTRTHEMYKQIVQPQCKIPLPGGPVAFSLILFLLSFHAQGLVFRVTDTEDTTNRSSLRGATIEANRLGGENLIILTSGTHRLSIQGPDEEA